MRKVKIFDGAAAIIDEDNVDTDQICPARFLHTPRADGYADKLFRDLRFDSKGDETDFILNQPPFDEACILVGGDNFGCGSSREQAVWALDDFGIRAVVAPKFGDIFRGNCVKNGIVPIMFDDGTLVDIKAALAKSPRAEIDLPKQTFSIGDRTWDFEMDAFSKDRLTTGISEIAETLKDNATLESFEARYASDYPWMNS